MIQEIAEASSLSLTFTAIFVCLWVCWEWRKQSSGKKFQHTDAVSWFTLGVFCHFLFSTGDNAYWGYAWTLSYIDSPNVAKAFNNGVYYNIPFRQLGTIFAGYCHLRAASIVKGWPLKRLHQALFVSLLIGTFYVWVITP